MNNEIIEREKSKFNSYTKEEKERWIRQMSRLYLYDSSLKPGEVYPGINIKDIIK